MLRRIERALRETVLLMLVSATSWLSACGNAAQSGSGEAGQGATGDNGGASGMAAAGHAEMTTAGAPSGGSAPLAAGGASATGGASTTGGTGGGETSAGNPGQGGSPPASAGTSSGTSGTAGNARGGAGPGSGGRAGAGAGSGGTATAGSSAGEAPTGGCTIGAFPSADPAMAGPFTAMTENEVGPDGTFTMFRPSDLSQGGLCHPLITWGNGHGTTPTLYARFLNHLASHGFVVIASNSSTVSMGDPPPMIAGVDWVLEQNADPSSKLYQRIDTTHIGATGHSEGAFATVTAAGDERITVVAPIEGASSSRNYHGPSLFLCGGMDTTVGCDGAKSALNGITTLPAMYANQLAATHTNWMIGSQGAALNPFMIAVTGWMRVHLMADAAAKSMFYGADCTLCTDSATWEVQQKNLE